MTALRKLKHDGNYITSTNIYCYFFRLLFYSYFNLFITNIQYTIINIIVDVYKRQ